MNWFTNLFCHKLIPTVNDKVIAQYREAGLQFGAAAAEVGSWGECIGFGDLLKAWEDAERKYVELGYRAVSVDEFLEAAHWGIPFKSFKKPRYEGEEIIYHADRYRKYCLGKFKPIMMEAWDELQKGNYVLGNYRTPSTK